jgi:hypothetical protein
MLAAISHWINVYPAPISSPAAITGGLQIRNVFTKEHCNAANGTETH